MKTAVMGLLIPFIGTAAGAACVFFLRKDLKISIQRALTGFAAGVMVAASIWSLIVPAIEQASAMGRYAFLPAFIGFWLGILFLLLLDHIIPHLHRSIDQAEGPKSHLPKTAMMVLAVTLHNIPEGMAVGVVYAGLLSGSENITAGGALALALGIAIQNFPEGAIISMPLYAEGKSKMKSFRLGVLSGAVEPVFGALTIIIAGLVVPAMPYLLSFAAGAMLYVVVEELIPEMSAGVHSNIGVVSFAIGFSVMMALEATANVDPENEKELTEAIENLTKQKTIIMIAHRLKTVRNADQIIVVDKGKIVQKGKHEELVCQEGIYKNFITGRKQAVSWKLA